MLKFDKAPLLIFLVGLAGACTFFGTTGIEPLKYLAVPGLIYAIYLALTMLRECRSYINWHLAIPALAILSFFPLVHVAMDVIAEPSAKHLIDGFFINCPYYFLPVFALAVVGYLNKTAQGSDSAVALSVTNFVPFAVVLAIAGDVSLASDTAAAMFVFFNNMFVPGALLMLRGGVKNVRLGILCLAVLFVLVALQGARSYMLVGLYILVFAVLGLFLTRNASRQFASIIGMGIVAAVLVSFVPFRELQQMPLFEKLDLQSLQDVVRLAISTSDLQYLYYWDGNSRAILLLDAFSNFSQQDWLWGRGIFGIYQSFVPRNTIEIGWAQELFWFGLPYVAAVISVALLAMVRLSIRYVKGHKASAFFFFSVIMVRFLDGWAYGLPGEDIYNFLFFIAIMSSLTSAEVGLAPISATGTAEAVGERSLPAGDAIGSGAV